MKTRLFTFILLATMMMSYSSCSSDDPYSNDTEQVEKDKLIKDISYTVFKHETTKNDLYIGGLEVTEKQKLYFRYNTSFESYFTITGNILTNLGNQKYSWKVIDKNTLEGMTDFTKGTWKRKQVDNGESNNNSNNNLKINLDSIAKIIGLNTFINTDTNDKLEIYAWTKYDSNLKNHCFKASYTISKKGLKGVNIKLMVRYTVGYYWLYSEKDGVALDPVWVYKDENILTSDLPDLKGTWKKIRR